MLTASTYIGANKAKHTHRISPALIKNMVEKPCTVCGEATLCTPRFVERLERVSNSKAEIVCDICNSKKPVEADVGIINADPDYHKEMRRHAAEMN